MGHSNQAQSLIQRMGLAAALSVCGAALILGGCGGHQQTATPMPPATPPQAYTEPEQRHANPGVGLAGRNRLQQHVR